MNQRRQNRNTQNKSNRSNKKSSNRRRNDRHNNQKKKEIKWTDKLSEHYSKKDFNCKESGNFKISLGLVGALELLRAKAKQHVIIIKGFESLEVAEKRGDFKRNFHTQGLAADIKVDGMDEKELFKLAEDIEEFKGIGLNVNEHYVHVDTRKADERLLWIEKGDEKIDIDDSNRSTYLG